MSGTLHETQKPTIELFWRGLQFHCFPLYSSPEMWPYVRTDSDTSRIWFFLSVFISFVCPTAVVSMAGSSGPLVNMGFTQGWHMAVSCGDKVLKVQLFSQQWLSYFTLLVYVQNHWVLIFRGHTQCLSELQIKTIASSAVSLSICIAFWAFVLSYI